MVAAIGASASGLRAEDAERASDRVQGAITKAIPLLESGSRGSADERTCFTCHNQALPILALTAARERGFSIDEDNLQRQLRHTIEHLARGKDGYREGRGQGGQAITAGYALWALEAGDWTADETTEAVVSYLLQHQKDEIRWSHPGKRPPSSGSDFTTTYVALRGLTTFGTDVQQPDVETRSRSVSDWLLGNVATDTEDRVFRLFALKHVDADEQAIDAAAEELLASQLGDGGWAQTADRTSDAYATGSAIVALLQAADLPHDDTSITRGIKYLLKTQCEDGSWHVTSRAEPFQTYYESGFPHGTDQFISIAASSWATLALLESLPDDQ